MKRKVVIASALIIIMVIITTVCCLLFLGDKEITEEDYKKNPKYILEEVIVSQEGEHFKLPKVKKVWEYNFGEEECYASGIVEISERNYNGIIDQLENYLKIPRAEDGVYKDVYQYIDYYRRTFVVDNTVYEGKALSEMEAGQLVSVPTDANIVYIIEPQDCKYQTEKEGMMLMAIFMIKKYDKHYLAFVRTTEGVLFGPYN